jgi:2-keto-4-pentenoate hydratase
MSDAMLDHARRLLAANHNHQPLPLLPGTKVQSLLYGYTVQRAYLDLLAVGPAARQVTGFKAALTNLAAQQALQMTGPVGGVLLSGHDYASGCKISAAKFVRPMIEVEIGYRLASAVTSPVSTDTLDGFIEAVLPMIEIADVGYVIPNAAGRSISGADLVAANAAAGGYIIGDPMFHAEDPDQLHIQLYRDGEVLSTTRGQDALGGQRALLIWLINHSLAQGYELLQGHYLMTGALGRVEAARPGRYLAEYRDATADGEALFGCVEFEVI